MIHREYTIPNMECTMCVMHLEAIEDELEGIKKVQASYLKQTMVVDFDETVVNEDQIIAAIEEKGYVVSG